MNKIYPFKFLDAYDKDDTGLFFGRDEEINDLYQMVFQTNILMVYGASGTGKTSLIQCGLASKFQSHKWLALSIRRGNDLNAAFDKVLADAGGNEIQEDDSIDFSDIMSDEPGPTTAKKELTPLAKSFKAIYLKYFRPIYLIFDQFEELFILGRREEQLQFLQTVQELLKVEQPVKMIFIIREEYLGHLYDFEKAIPQLMRKKLRVEPMNLDKVRQVLTGVSSYAGSNISIKAGQEQAITESIFDKIKGSDKTLTIQLPYLQVFLDKLYLETTHDDTRSVDAVFTIDTIHQMGDIGDVLRNFLEEQVKTISQKLTTEDVPVTTNDIWKILSPFATLEGTKEPISMQSLVQRLAGMNAKLVTDTVDAFVKSRILRHTEQDDIYELAHDSLAGKIAGKRTDEEIALLEIKRLIKGQVSMKADARELFTEKQMNFIEPYLDKLSLTNEETDLINNSRAEIRTQRNKRKRRFIVVISGMAVAMAIMLFLTWSTYNANIVSRRNEEMARKSQEQATKQYNDLLKERALSKAKALASSGDQYKDNGNFEYARASYQAALDSLRDYPGEPLYERITKNMKECH